VTPNTANAIDSFRIIAASELPEQAITGASLVGETKPRVANHFALVSDFRSRMIV
jgi:hypothetical protein